MTLIIGVLGRPKTTTEFETMYFNKEVTDVVVEYNHIPLGIIAPVIEIDNQMNDAAIEKLHKVIDLCDGIILQGGSDFYQYDLAATQYIYKKNIPVLGICLGMQTIGSFFGANLDDVNNHHHPEMPYVHDVEVKDNTIFRKITGQNQIKVNSRHHQMIVNPTNIDVVGYNGNVIEAIEKSDALFMLGVQWHPESMIKYDEVSRKIFDAFFSACEVYHHQMKSDN